MDLFKTWMFNRRASSAKSKPEEVLNALGLTPGQNIADIGIGGGYFSFRFAEAVGKEGIVFGVDTNRGFLSLLGKNAGKKGLGNIKTLPASELIQIPEKTLDMVFLRNVYHHLEDRVNYFMIISKLLKADGRIAIIEYKERKGFNLFPLIGHPPHHHTSQEKIVQEIEEAGYTLNKSFNFLSEQSFTIFKKKQSD